MDASGQDSIVKALRRLTIAVWALTAVMAVFVGMYLVAYIPYFSFSTSPVTESAQSQPGPPSRSESRYENLYALPLETQIEAASVIAVAKYEKDGERNKCVISEILKQAPGVKFYYKLGDEFRQCSHYPKTGESRGDGQLMFFVGSPAEFRYSTTFHGDRLGGLGDMPFELLRKQIKEGSK
jgi:hypothetical protein